MHEEYKMEKLREIIRADAYSFGGGTYPVKATPAIDMAKAVVKYANEEEETFHRVKELRRQLEYTEKKLEETIEKKEIAYEAFNALLPEGTTMESLYEIADKKLTIK